MPPSYLVAEYIGRDGLNSQVYYSRTLRRHFWCIECHRSPRSPGQLVIHWNAAGQPDGTMAKTPALVLIPALSAVLLIFFAGTLLIFAVNNRKISEWREELKSERRGMPVSDVEAIADDGATDF